MGWRENLNSDSKDFIDFNDKNTSNGDLNHLNQFNREVWGWRWVLQPESFPNLHFLLDMDEENRFEFMERIAIMEIDGGMSREEAVKQNIERVLTKSGNYPVDGKGSSGFVRPGMRRRFYSTEPSAKGKILFVNLCRTPTEKPSPSVRKE